MHIHALSILDGKYVCVCVFPLVYIIWRIITKQKTSMDGHRLHHPILGTKPYNFREFYNWLVVLKNIETYESQWEGWHPINHGKKKCLKPPTRQKYSYFINPIKPMGFSHQKLMEKPIWAMVNTHYMVDGHPIHNMDPYNGYYKSLWTIGWLAAINGY